MKHPHLYPALAAISLTVVCILAYRPGLYGAFIFDDIANLGAVQNWIAGAVGWRSVVFENLSGPLGRPISMATFLIDGAIWGMDPFGFKLGNLMLHLATGIAVFFLVKEIAKRSINTHTDPALLALVITTVWLLHPIQAGTVLYVIQRMAMLSTLFIVMTLLAYMIGRVHMEAGRARRGSIWLFITVPLLTMLAAFSKENGLLALLLCGVVEWGWFRAMPGASRPRAVRLFLIWLVAAPILVGLFLLLVQPELFLADYGNRRFNLTERLLTQSRVLFDYTGKLLWPSKLSMFRDEYTVSTGLFSPPITSFALLGWAAVVTAAIRLRSRLPLFSGGVAIYLVGHLMESSVFPLMIYFEHRNYLPSLGVWLAVSGLLLPLWQHLRPKMDTPHAVAAIGLVGLFAVLSFATHGRALVWETKELLIRQSLQHYPNSRFIRTELAALEMNRQFRNAPAAREYLYPLLESDRPLVRMIGELALFKIDCISGIGVHQSDLDRVFLIVPETLEADLVMSHRGLIEMSKNPPCSGLEPGLLATYLSTWLDQVPQPEELQLKARLRLETAKLFMQGRDFQNALSQLRLAQLSKLSPSENGLLMAALYVERGEFSKASEKLEEIAASIDPGDAGSMTRLQELREAVLVARESKPSKSNG